MFLRNVPLPDGIPGELLLTRIPGRTDFENERQQIAARGVDVMLCLIPPRDLASYAPEYAAAIQSGELPWQQWSIPMPDFSPPDDPEAALERVRAAADLLRQGKRILVHCFAGIGRTGTIAACLLVALGVDRHAALEAVYAAGSHPEAASQQEFIRWAAGRLGGAS